MFSLHKKNPHEPACFVCHIIVSLLLLLSAAAALFGVFVAHYDARLDTLIFGTNADSLSLIAFVLCLTLWMKSMKACVGKCDTCGTGGKK